VAIKRFTMIDLAPEALKEFYDEAQLMSQLSHRNIVLFMGACLQVTLSINHISGLLQM
jgi:hypothetical protein